MKVLIVDDDLTSIAMLSHDIGKVAIPDCVLLKPITHDVAKSVIEQAQRKTIH